MAFGTEAFPLQKTLCDLPDLAEGANFLFKTNASPPGAVWASVVDPGSLSEALTDSVEAVQAYNWMEAGGSGSAPVAFPIETTLSDHPLVIEAINYLADTFYSA